MSRWIRNAGLVLMPALLLSVALLGCSGGDGKKGDKKGDDKKGDGTPAGDMKKVPVGKGTITGTIKLKEGVEPDVKELEAELKTKIDKNKNKAACAEAYKQTAWIVGKDRGVKNVAVWLMPEKEEEFFDVKGLVEKKGFEQVMYLDQPHCHFDPRVSVFFPGYVNPDNPGSADSPKYVKSGQKFYALNPETDPNVQHNTKLTPVTGAGQEVNEVLGHSTKNKLEKAADLIAKGKLKPYDLSRGPIRISCNIHDWMEAWAWALPHPLGTTTDEKGNYKIENVPDSGKVRLFVWHEKAGFINEGGKQGQLINAKDAKQDFTITKTT